MFPEAQPREWAGFSDSSSEGLGNNSGVKTLGFRALLARNDLTRLGCSFGRYSKPVRLRL